MRGGLAFGGPGLEGGPSLAREGVPARVGVLAGVWPGRGWVLHHDDNNNDNADMTPQGRPDFVAFGLKM